VLLHLVDGTGEDAGRDYRTVRDEIEAYGHGLAEKGEIVALSKADALDQDARAAQLARLGEASGQTPLLLSAASGEGVEAVTRRLADAVQVRPSGAEPAREAAWQP
jgi:GTP-binding protein